MKYILDIDIEENKLAFAEEFFKTISFVKKVRVIPNNELLNPSISQSIEDYETGKVSPTVLNLAELKTILDA